MITAIYCLSVLAIIYGSYRLQYKKYNSAAENIAMTMLVAYFFVLNFTAIGNGVYLFHALFKDFVTTILN